MLEYLYIREEIQLLKEEIRLSKRGVQLLKRGYAQQFSKLNVKL